MSATIFIPTPLRPYTGDQESLELEGSTVGEVLRNLAEQYGDLKKHLFDEEGKLRNFVNIYVNDEDIRYLDREETAIQDKDTISIVPSIAGGAIVSEFPVVNFPCLTPVYGNDHIGIPGPGMVLIVG